MAGIEATEQGMLPWFHARGFRLSGDCQFLFQLLFLVETGVIPIAKQQVFMSAELDDAAMVEHGDLVGMAHGGNAV